MWLAIVWTLALPAAKIELSPWHLVTCLTEYLPTTVSVNLYLWLPDCDGVSLPTRVAVFKPAAFNQCAMVH